MASQDEGKPRRSFIPGPKKPPGVSPTSPRAPDLPQSRATSLSTAAGKSPLTPAELAAPPSSHGTAAREDPKALLPRTLQVEAPAPSKQVDEQAYGVGLRVGARVRIGGIKPGTLRYLGTTHLAPGIFCGIELLEPDGNHDGEVNGHRYFVCAPNHGIFAPKEKVCLDSACGLGRLASDSDVCYGSTESLNERSLKAFKSFEEGELEAVDCTKLSPIISPQDNVLIDTKRTLTKNPNRASLRNEAKSKDSRYLSTAPLGSVTSIDHNSSSAFSGAAKSNLAASTYSRLPTLSRTYSKLNENQTYNASPSHPNSHTSHPVISSSSEANQKYPNTTAPSESILDQHEKLVRNGTVIVRSVDDLDEDVFVRDTLSHGVKRQLKADSRQYLNFTFDEDDQGLEPLSANYVEVDVDLPVQDLNSTYVLRASSLLSDSVFRRPSSGYSSSGSCYREDFHSIKAKDSFGDHNFMQLETATVTLRTHNTGHNSASHQPEIGPVMASESYTILSNQVYGESDAVIFLDSANDEDNDELSLTRTLSHSDLPSEDFLPYTEVDVNRTLSFEKPPSPLLPSLSSDVLNTTQTIATPFTDTLNTSQTLLVHGSESYVISGEAESSCVLPSQSYTVLAGDHDSKRDSSKRERDSTSLIAASQSYIISKSDSAASSPRRKYRKMSTSSSANEGGDSSSSGTDPKTDSSGDTKADNLDDSSTGASPEVSQALEWDYGQEFEGKIPPGHPDNPMTMSTSTGTSESLSDVLRDISEHGDGLFDAETASNVTEDSDQFETPDNEFETIDSLEDFPIFGKDSVTVMTDSGISDKDFEFCPHKSSSVVCGSSSDDCSREDDASSLTTTRAISSDSSQETLAAEYVADTPGSVEDKDFLSDDMCTVIHQAAGDGDEGSRRDSCGDGYSTSPASVVSLEESGALQDRTLLCDEDLHDSEEGLKRDDSIGGARFSCLASTTVIHCTGWLRSEPSEGADSGVKLTAKRERPTSILSTTSADTGYVADSDSELGPLTGSSPSLDWQDRYGHVYSVPASDSGLVCDTDFQNATQVYQSHMGQLSTYTPDLLSYDGLTKHDDEDNSDLMLTSEDDRIEADQVYEQWPKGPLPSSEVVVKDVSGHAADGPELLSQEQVDNISALGSPEALLRPPQGSSRKEPVSHLTKEDGPQDRSRPKKATAKKRTENLDFKMPRTNVTSRVADYIKAPTSQRQQESQEKDTKAKAVTKNLKQNVQKRLSLTEVGSTKFRLTSSRDSSVDANPTPRVHSTERAQPEKLEKSKLALKRTPPKSKWKNIMTQIEASKDTVKPRPKSEIKSSLAVYLNVPSQPLHLPPSDTNTVTINMVKQDESNHRRKEMKPKTKQLPPPPPRISLNNVKSKINTQRTGLAVKTSLQRENSPGAANKKTSGNSYKTCPLKNTEAGHKKMGVQRISDGSIVLHMQPVLGSLGSAKNSHTDVSICVSTESVAGSLLDEGTPSKRGSGDQGLRDGRPSSSHSYRSDHSENIKPGRENQASNGRHTSGQGSSFCYSRKPKMGVTSKGTLNTGQDVAPPPGISAAAQDEIVRLESLCESRTKELTHTRIQLRASNQAFDAMAVLFKYCCADLKAFECPALAKKLETVQRQLADCINQIGDLSFQKEALEESLSRTRQEKEEVTRQMEETQAAVERQQQEHAQITQEMDSTHNAALTAQRDELTSKHDENVHKLNQVYERQLETLRLVHDRQMLDLKNEFKLESNALKISHLEEIQALRNKHDDQMEELHKQHRGKLEDITHRFESIKLSLSEKVESLRCECDDLARRARNSEEALQRDAETKVQIALAPYLNLPNEIDSLKIVLEMRNEEIQKLRTKNMDVEKQLEEVPIGREKIISLQQKVENLEAIINIKTDHEKQLHEKCQKLMRKYDHESRTNKRLSRDYEQVLWRMSQSSEFGGSCESLMRQLSRSPPRSKESSPDSRQSANSQKLDNDVDGVVMRVKKRSSQSVSEGDRKLRSRSATFVVEKIDSSDSHSPSCSPQLKQKRWRHKSQNQDVTPVNETADWTCESTTENESSSDFCQINSESTKDMTESCRMSSSDMSNSYTRSLSVVSDSGMCDSMTKSDDVFNSLVVSSDSEWGTSVNLSVNCEFVLSDSQCAEDVGDIHSFSEATLVLTNPSESSFTAINKSQHL